MGKPTFGQVAVLRVEDHRQIEGGGIFQGAAQVAIAGKFGEAVTESDAAGFAQRDQFRQLLASQIARQRTDGKYLGVARLAGTIEDQLGDCRSVQDRARLRRAAQAGDAAGRCCEGLAGNAALAAVARLAQRHGEIDQAGCGDQSLAIDRPLRFETSRGLADGGDLAMLQENIGDFVTPADGVDHARAEDSNCHHHCCSSDTDSESIWRCAVCPLIAMDSTAMRMAMP